jgi:hypothetical protein
MMTGGLQRRIVAFGDANCSMGTDEGRLNMPESYGLK